LIVTAAITAIPGFAFKFQGLEGTPSAVTSLVSMPKAAVRRMLPKGLDLQSQNLSPPGEHPVILFTGRQQGLRAIGYPLTFPTYLEYILAIPFVGFKSNPNSAPLMHLATLYLNSPLAVLAGRYFYGMPKRLEGISWTDDFLVTTLVSSQALVRAGYRERSNWDPVAFRKNLATVSALYAQPLVQVKNGAYLCAKANWHFDTAQAEPVDAEIQLRTDSKELNFSVPGSDESVFGAFHFSTHWELEAGHSCTGATGRENLALHQ
jgi:hypothetical protein